MQTVRQAINDLSYVLGVPRTRVNTVARVLIDGGVLPKSAGKDIKRIDAVQLSGFVAAVAMAEKVDQAVETAETIMNLRLSGDPKGVSFKAAFAANINTAEHEAAPTLIFSRLPSGLTAELSGRFIFDGELSEGKASFWSERTWGGWTKTSFTLAPEGFVILRKAVHRQVGSGDAVVTRPDGRVPPGHPAGRRAPA